MKRAAIAIAAVVAAGALATAALALTDPKTLALRTSDFPAGAVAGPSYTVPGSTFGAKDYSVVINFRRGGREEEVTSDVAVSRNAKDAATGYDRFVAAYTGMAGSTPLKLPSYGDEQKAEYFSSSMVAKATLVVRKGAVTWRLDVESCGPAAAAGCLFGHTPPKLTKAQALADMKVFAAKQKTHIR